MNAAVTGEELEQTEESRRSALDSLTIRHRLTGEQAAARSVIVRRLRIALPIIALLLIGALVINTRSTDGDDAFLDDFANLDTAPEELKMANPRFAGVDDKGYPYEITADAALQAPGKQELVELVKPRAVTKGANEETLVHAEKGVYQSDANVLTLSDGVTLEHEIGGDKYQLRTNEATVSIDDETVHAHSAVEGEGAAGTLRADSMRAYNNEGRVVFEGNVSMRIYPDKAKQAQAKTKSDKEEPENP